SGPHDVDAPLPPVEPVRLEPWMRSLVLTECERDGRLDAAEAEAIEPAGLFDECGDEPRLEIAGFDGMHSSGKRGERKNGEEATWCHRRVCPAGGMRRLSRGIAGPQDVTTQQEIDPRPALDRGLHVLSTWITGCGDRRSSYRRRGWGGSSRGCCRSSG